MHLQYLNQILQLLNSFLCFAFGSPPHARAAVDFVTTNKAVFLPLLQEWMLDLGLTQFPGLDEQ